MLTSHCIGLRPSAVEIFTFYIKFNIFTKQNYLQKCLRKISWHCCFKGHCVDDGYQLKVWILELTSNACRNHQLYPVFPSLFSHSSPSPSPLIGWPELGGGEKWLTHTVSKSGIEIPNFFLCHSHFQGYRGGHHVHLNFYQWIDKQNCFVLLLINQM